MKLWKITVILVTSVIVVTASALFYFSNRYPTTCFDDSPPFEINTTTSSAAPNQRIDSDSANAISVANVQNLVELRAFTMQKYPIVALAISSDSTFVVSASLSRRVKVYYLDTGESFSFPETEHGAATLAISPDNKILATYDYPGVITLWDIASRTELVSWDVANPSYGKGLVFTPQGEIVYATVGAVFLCNLATKENKRLFIQRGLAALTKVDLDRDGNNLVFSNNGDNDSNGTPEVGIWNMNNQSKVASFEYTSQITGISLSLDGQRLAVAGIGGGIEVINTQSNQTHSSFSSRTGPGYHIALNFDGSLIAVGDERDRADSHLAIWVVDQNSLVTQLNSEEQITSLIFNPTGSLLITVGKKGTVTVWGLPE